MNIYPYKKYSASAAVLSKALGIKRIKHDKSRFVGRGNRTVINWGATDLPDQVRKCNILNHPACVAMASNKLALLSVLEEHDGVNIPEFTQDREEAQQWAEEGDAVVCRTLLRASAARGIVMADTPDEVVAAPLYTKYVKKKDEYRVHVFNGEIIDFQRKARKLEIPDDDIDWRVRVHANGFNFIREGVALPDAVSHQALACMHPTGLHFGAVDIIYQPRADKAYVLEINTAPGLEGQTLETYSKAFKGEM